MPTCKYCAKEFATAAALGGHVRHKHPEGKETENTPRASLDTRCPVCQYEQPFTTGWEDNGLTVCSRCFTMFDKHTKEVHSDRGAKLRQLGVLPPLAK